LNFEREALNPYTIELLNN